eukprot:gnl/Dysnectes_brevis/714_a787_2987.p1 GENE.gnl/Dysnectes_brevis/714_a787_2987~~gnl/Dysnectes_brevis/714_a787_2987.p1  ORF type:complete len:252 (+),score=66.42 gnl/Dysnectes_brevis/714_a787_2987:626-1381(+)
MMMNQNPMTDVGVSPMADPNQMQDAKIAQELIEDQIACSVRVAFLRKVYLTLAIMLSINVAEVFVSYSFFGGGTLQVNTDAAMTMMIAGAIGLFVFMIAAFCARKSSPINLVFLCLTAFSMGGVISGLCLFYSIFDILAAAAATMIIVVLCTIYAFSVTDISGIMPFIMIILVGYGLMWLGYPLYFSGIGDGVATYFYSSLGALVFSSYLVIDTWLMVERYPVDEWVIATIQIYVDIVYMFLYILMLFGNN